MVVYFSKPVSRRRRGSVIVLVVATLALLAVIGTIYIVSARTARNNASAAHPVINNNLAQDAAQKIALEAIGNSILDAYGRVGGYGFDVASTVGRYPARRHTFPEWNVGGQGVTLSNNIQRDQSWLVQYIYRPNQAVQNDFPVDDLSVFSANGFNPQSGSFDFAAAYDPNTFPYYVNAVSEKFTNPVQGSNPIPVGPTADWTTDSFMQLLPFTDASGLRYRFGLRIVDTSRAANLNVGSTVDPRTGTLNDLDVNGTFYSSYLLGMTQGTAGEMIFDSTDTSNLLDAAAGRIGAWTSTFAYPTLNYQFDWMKGVALQLDNGAGGASPFDLADELELRTLGTIGSTYRARPAMNGAAVLWPNTLGNIYGAGNVPTGNPRRGLYTTYSVSRDLRMSMDFKQNPSVPTSEPYTLTPKSFAATNVFVTSPRVFPPAPARVAANPIVALAGPADIEILAGAATNLAQVMESAGYPQGTGGYSHAEACAFAANYLTCRWNGWQDAGNGFQLPDGPSFIDDQGICFRGPTGIYEEFGTTATDLKSEVAGKKYMGYAAQPFVNEIAVYLTVDSTSGPTPKWVISHVAVELYNPYDQPLDLTDYQFKLGAVALKLTGKISPHGFFVLKTAGWPFPINGVVGHFDSGDLGFPDLNTLATTQLQLQRRYRPRGAATNDFYYTIDQYNYGTLLPGAASTTIPAPVSATDSPVTYFVRRDNYDRGDDEPNWSTTIHDPTTSEAPHLHNPPTDECTLGAENKGDTGAPANNSIQEAPALFDRVITSAATTPPPAAGSQGNVLFRNIGEFNRLMRICHEVDAVGDPLVSLTDRGVISQYLNTIVGAGDPKVQNTQFPVEASLHFDFKAHPSIFETHTAYTNTTFAGTPFGAPAQTIATPPAGTYLGDIRAFYVLENINFIDRVSDNLSFNLGDNDLIHRGISKIRIPGRINVNTAPEEVLGCVPGLVLNPGTGKYDQDIADYVGAIIAYRSRPRQVNAGDTFIRSPYNKMAYDFTDTAKFPGRGIRSLGELLTVFGEVDRAKGKIHGSMFERDKAWERAYNVLTVRSDTFAVYGYLEAVRQHPRYDSTLNPNIFATADTWYKNAATDVTDNPNATNIPLLRVSKRRWVSIVDSSFCNYDRFDATGAINPLFTTPKIVATKELPE